MTDIETEIIAFMRDSDEGMPEIDRILQTFIHTISEDKIAVAYKFEGERVSVGFVSLEKSAYTEYMEPEMLFYIMGAVLGATQNEDVQEQYETLSKAGLDIGEIFVYYFNILLGQLRIEAAEWELLEKP